MLTSVCVVLSAAVYSRLISRVMSLCNCATVPFTC